MTDEVTSARDRYHPFEGRMEGLFTLLTSVKRASHKPPGESLGGLTERDSPVSMVPVKEVLYSQELNGTSCEIPRGSYKMLGTVLTMEVL